MDQRCNLFALIQILRCNCALQPIRGGTRRHPEDSRGWQKLTIKSGVFTMPDLPHCPQERNSSTTSKRGSLVFRLDAVNAPTPTKEKHFARRPVQGCIYTKSTMDGASVPSLSGFCSSKAYRDDGDSRGCKAPTTRTGYTSNLLPHIYKTPVTRNIDHSSIPTEQTVCRLWSRSAAWG